MSRLRRAAAAAAILLAAAGSADAQSFEDYPAIGLLEDERRRASNLRVGGHSFEPTLTLKLLDLFTPHVFAAAAAGYTDNLLRQDAEALGVKLRREPYGRLEAGARLDAELSDHRLELDYRALVHEYWETGDLDTFEQRSSARIDLIFVDLALHGDVVVERQAYPQSIQLTGVIRTDTFLGKLWGEARFGRFGLRVGGYARRDDFLSRTLRDLDANAYGADVQVYGRITPRLRAVVEYNWSVVDYEQGRSGSLNDYQSHVVRGGVDGAFSPKLNASLKVGAAFQDVQRTANVDDREFKSVVAALSASYEVLTGTRLTAAYGRSLEPSTSSNFLATDSVSLRASQLLFDEQLRLDASAAYTRSKVSRGDAIDRFRAAFGAHYNIRKWLSVVGEYSFTRLGSFVADGDYRIHTLSISLGVGL